MTPEQRKGAITFSPHAVHRALHWNMSLDKIERTVRDGEVKEEKCEPGKLCLERYDGKERRTYVVIVRCHKEFMEVRRTWPRKGR